MSTTTRTTRGRGGRGGHESRARILAREQRVLELAVLGWRQHQIAADVGVSQAAISKILKRVELRLAQDIEETKGRQRIRQSLKLEHMYATSMTSFVASQADSTRRKQRKHLGADGQTGGSVAEIVSENQHGDPRYLEVARKALADQRKLWGLDAPTKVDLRTSHNPYVQMTEAELRCELARQTHLLGVSMAGTETLAAESPAIKDAVILPEDADADGH